VCAKSSEYIVLRSTNIADAGPYTLDEIGPEFPFHPNCNCSLVPRDIADAA
jgi:hypothetical protein